VPNFVTSFSSYKLKNASVDLCSNLRKARSLAVKQNRDVSIQFNVTENTYSIDGGSKVEMDKDGISFGNGTATVGAKDCSDSIPSDGVSFQSDKTTINNQGICRDDGCVYLQNAKGEAYAVGVHTSGRIVLWHWSNGSWN